jgi:hypothetical protein
VPKERVRLDKDTVTDEETVPEQVRQQRIDVDADDPRSPARDGGGFAGSSPFARSQSALSSLSRKV